MRKTCKAWDVGDRLEAVSDWQLENRTTLQDFLCRCLAQPEKVKPQKSRK